MSSNITEKNVTTIQNSEFPANSETLNFFKPEICEIRILPNGKLFCFCPIFIIISCVACYV